MSTSNKVFQVLVTKGNQAVAAKDTEVSALKPGQLGFFDADSNLALDGTVIPDTWYMAVGLGSGATASDIRTSAGQEIQTRNIRHFTYKKASQGTPTIIEISDFVGMCGEDFSLRIEATTLQGMNIYGFRPLRKTYAIQTSCCEGCEPCPSGSKAEVAGKLVNKVNSDPEAFVKAELVNSTGSVVADVNAYMADPANKDLAVKIRLTSKPFAFFADGADYKQTHGFDGAGISAFLSAGFNCSGTVKIVQQGTQSEGLGHFIVEKEYIAGGYNGNPGVYRTSGMFNETYPGTMFLSSADAQYSQINLIYDHHSKSGWLDYLNDLNTLLAIPKDDTTTVTGALGVISKLVAGLGLKEIKDADTVEKAEKENA